MLRCVGLNSRRLPRTFALALLTGALPLSACGGSEEGSEDSSSEESDAGDGDGSSGSANTEDGSADSTTGTGDGDGDAGDGDTGDGDAGDGDTGDGDTGDGDGDTCPGTQTGCVIDWAGSFGNQGTMDGVGDAARFNFIAGFTSTGAYLYVADNSSIRRVEISSADVTTWAGSPGVQAFADGQGIAARFHETVGLATDGTSIWVADAQNYLVREIDISSAQVTTIAGQMGNAGSNDGIAAATFEAMRDMVWDGNYLYLVQSNALVRRVDVADGTVLTLAGQAGQSGLVDGTGATARFAGPRFIEHANGRFFIGDTENHRPRLLLDSNGIGDVTSPYGSSSGYADGNGSAAQFDRLRGLAFDGNNALVVSDSDNYVLREIDLTSGEVTTLAGMAGSNAHLEGLYDAAAFDKNLEMHFDAGTGDLFISEGTVIRRMYYK